MKKIIKSILSVILAISMLLCATVSSFAASEEEYLADIRIIYADDYEEAEAILADSEFSDYKLLDENLNADTGEIGTWIAYKSTTDIEDAITDIAIMQMGGGYNEGNYQQMIAESYNEYVEMGRTYLDAIEYFVWAYDEGDFLAESAYRQLNFYNVETQEDAGIDPPDFEGELLGDIFYEGIDENELATMFLEGNSYALKNIRALISMGVSYNEDGKTYFGKVGEEAAKVKADPNVYADEDYDELAEFVAASLAGVRGLLSELAAHEDELDYTDDELTETELHYVEVNTVANIMRDIKYLNDQTLYDFFMNYKHNKDDLSPLYPLVAALNDGQIAMTKVAHYYDVLRYSAVFIDEELINEELEKLEETYSEDPFNIYTGVDRTIYRGTFALTTAADRADAYSEIDIMDTFLGTSERNTALDVTIATGMLSAFFFTLGGISRYFDISDVYNTAVHNVGNTYAYTSYGNPLTYQNLIDDMYNMYHSTSSTLTLADKVAVLKSDMAAGNVLDANQAAWLRDFANKVSKEQTNIAPAGAPVSMATAAFFIIGGALMVYSAFNIISTVYHYYNPEYDDIPIAMVDLVETIDGDRYIKYDVAYEAEAREDGKYSAGDLNAFEGLRWNALYYTKSYEAGKPLLADEFVVSNSSNQPKENYAGVHAFGDVVCFDLNRHTFDDDTSIYLSVKQSKNNKSAVADVPEVVGSMFGAGFLFLAGGIGAVAGIGGTVAAQGIAKKKKSNYPEAESEDEALNS